MEKKKQRKLIIMQSLAAMLEERDLLKITTAELAKRSEITEAAIYKHFPSKRKIFHMPQRAEHEQICRRNQQRADNRWRHMQTVLPQGREAEKTDKRENNGPAEKQARRRVAANIRQMGKKADKNQARENICKGTRIHSMPVSRTQKKGGAKHRPSNFNTDYLFPGNACCLFLRICRVIVAIKYIQCDRQTGSSAIFHDDIALIMPSNAC